MPPRRRPAKATGPKAGASAPAPLNFVQDPQQLLIPLAPAPGPAKPSQVVRLLRPDDLVVMEIRCFGMDLVKKAGKPQLVPADAHPYLVAGFTFQHVGEQAFELESGEVPFVPVEVRVAEPSRLVFDVPATEEIEFSTPGILAALSRLPLRVAPVALPRQMARLVVTPVISLPGGLALARSDAGLSVVRESGRPVAATTPTELIAHANTMRAARAMLAHESAVDLSGLLHDTGSRMTTVTARPGLAGARLGLGGAVRPVGPIRPIRQTPRTPKPDETAIEAPYRLIISPSALGGFNHATTPQAAPTDETRIELWHSRLGVRHVDAEGDVSIDEKDATQRIVRAIWARDKDGVEPTVDDNLPFRMSLDGLDRVTLVRQSADPTVTTPQPVDVTRLYLSSQGAWLDLHGKWDTQPYLKLAIHSIDSWDHIAPMGRDQYVKVVYPGYLFPFGHRCSLIKVTERRIDPGTNQAWLYQRKFIVVREPVKSYNDKTMPFTQVRLRPLVTPDIADPVEASTPATFPNPPAWGSGDLFFPIVNGDKFEFTLDCLDQDSRRVIVKAPLLFVAGNIGKTKADRDFIAAAYTKPDSGTTPKRGIPTGAQSVAFAVTDKPGKTAFETDTLRFTGDPGRPGDLSSDPHLETAVVVVPAMKRLAPQADPVEVSYAKPYLDEGFAGANSTAQIFLALTAAAKISFGDGAPGATTAKSGGFIQPDIPVRGLSRTLGTVGQTDSMVHPPAGKQPFDPLTYLDGVLPKLFGLFSLVDILRAVGLDHAPNFVTEALDQVAGWLADLAALQQALSDALGQLGQDATNAPTDKLRSDAADAANQLTTITGQFTSQFSALTDAISALTTSGDVSAFEAAAETALGNLAATLTDLAAKTQALSLPPVPKAQLDRLTKSLSDLQNGVAAEVTKRIESIVGFVQGLDPSKLAVKASFEWRPKLQNFPAGKDKDHALFYVDEDGLLLSIEARASGQDGVGVDVLAQLSNFGLNLFEDNTLIKIAIDRLSFRASNGHKPEVDVVMQDMAWQGVLGFIETLETLIPSDGFSDPPFVDVSESGVKAGFDLALPSIAVGVFSLENISLGADVAVPFLGEAVTIGFNFCTRDKPFRLTVMCVGGGGFVGLRVSPKGIVLLEMSLEACAQLAIDLGVASGSVSISVGVYLKLEANDGSLTGYFRVRGEVDVLGLISASITLELSLTYEFDSGKLVGRASIDIEVDIFMFSFSVSVSCERQLAGSNGDPTFAELLGITDDGTSVPNPGAPDGGVPAWTDYCAAFAEG